MQPTTPLHTGAYMGDPVFTPNQPQVRRSHLIEKAPTGEPVVQVQQREQTRDHLLQLIMGLEERISEVERELERRTLRGRWRSLQSWARGLWARFLKDNG